MRQNYEQEVEVQEDSIAARLLDEKMDIGLWLQDTVLKMAPMWLASIAFHVFIILVLSTISTGPGRKVDDSITVVDLDKKIPPPVEEIKEEFKEEDIQKETEEEEILKPETEVDDAEDTDKDLTPSPLKGKGVYDSIGIGGGLGGGGGRRGGRRKKAPAQTEDAVLAGLIWLAKHQNPDGSWGAKRFMNQCKGARCSGPGEEEFDIGLTSVSLLAFTGAGYSPSSKDEYEGICFGVVVKKAANFLVGIQDSQGVYGGVKSGKFIYNQAIASYAVADLYGLIKDSPSGVIFQDAAQKGIDYLISIQNPGKAWRYQPKDGQSDTSVSGWAAMAIKSAQLAELKVDYTVFNNVKSFYDDVTNQSDGVVGYTELGSVAVKANEHDPKIQPSMTAIGIMVRVFIDKSVKDPIIKKGVDRILQDLPTWNPSKLGEIDYYYWFYASYCLNQFDGPDGPCWKKWNERMKEVLVKNQHPKTDGCAWGSWDPIDRWGEEGSRVYSTAINCLTLEVYYRLGITRLK
ncbi:MAG: prenyltransferase/squalene oxidase repeat-containing protein [Planctomycetota bacterium]